MQITIQELSQQTLHYRDHNTTHNKQTQTTKTQINYNHPINHKQTPNHNNNNPYIETTAGNKAKI